VLAVFVIAVMSPEDSHVHPLGKFSLLKPEKALK
jgi:hypothetical protein